MRVVRHYDKIATRILITKLAAVGGRAAHDGVPASDPQAYPNAWITWVTAPSAVGLFVGNPLVDEVFTPDDPRLRVLHFDVVLSPDADPETAAIASAVNAETLVGFRLTPAATIEPTNEGAATWLAMGLDDTQKKANTETYQARVARVLELDPADVREPILEPTEGDLAFAKTLRPDAPKVVGINTGAGGRWERKRWATEHQKALIATLSEQGTGVLLLGGPEEAGTHEQLIPASPRAPVQSAGTDHSYQRFAALIDQCDALVTGDTMALHVACARKSRSWRCLVRLSVAEIEVYGRGEKIAPEGLDCLGCYLATCDVSPHCQEADRARDGAREPRSLGLKPRSGKRPRGKSPRRTLDGFRVDGWG